MKVIHQIIILMTIWAMGTNPLMAQEQIEKPRKKVALVLSGGGAKGMAHIGVIKVLERAGIPIDIVTGTSMGSIIGGLYSIGWNGTEMDSLVRKQDWGFLLSDREDYYSQSVINRERQNTYFFTKRLTMGGKRQVSDVGGIIAGRNLEKLFNRLTQGYGDSIDFNRLPRPFACVATNIINNTEYDFHSGRLAQAMRASMAIPAVFSPVRLDDKLLADGGLRNNYPADIAREMGADYVIGVLVQSKERGINGLKTSAQILGQIIDQNCKNKYDANLAITDIPIAVNVSGYSAASFSKNAVDSLIRRGEEAGMANWDKIMALKRQLGLADDYQPVKLHPNAEALLPVNFREDERQMRPERDQVLGSVGFRFDTEEMVALQLDGLYQMSKRPLDAELTLRLGKRIMAKTQGIWAMKNHAKMALGYTYRYNDFDVYKRGEEDYTLRYHHHQVAFSFLGVGIRNMVLDLTARWDYYRYAQMLKLAPVGHDDLSFSDDHFVSYHANLHYNSENMGTFATKGAKFQAEYAYFTDNFGDYKGSTGISILSAMWRISLAMNHRFTLQPMLYGRMLTGKEIPTILGNTIGGQWYGNFIEQQMPFAGMGHIQWVDKDFLAFQIKAQEQLTTNNFVLFKVAMAQNADRLRELMKHHTLWGTQLEYYYRTLFGPVGATFGYSNVAKGVNLYINIGFNF